MVTGGTLLNLNSMIHGSNPIAAFIHSMFSLVWDISTAAIRDKIHVICVLAQRVAQ